MIGLENMPAGSQEFNAPLSQLFANPDGSSLGRETAETEAHGFADLLAIQLQPEETEVIGADNSGLQPALGEPSEVLLPTTRNHDSLQPVRKNAKLAASNVSATGTVPTPAPAPTPGGLPPTMPPGSPLIRGPQPLINHPATTQISLDEAALATSKTAITAPPANLARRSSLTAEEMANVEPATAIGDKQPAAEATGLGPATRGGGAIKPLAPLPLTESATTTPGSIPSLIAAAATGMAQTAETTEVAVPDKPGSHSMRSGLVGRVGQNSNELPAAQQPRSTQPASSTAAPATGVADVDLGMRSLRAPSTQNATAIAGQTLNAPLSTTNTAAQGPVNPAPIALTHTATAPTDSSTKGSNPALLTSAGTHSRGSNPLHAGTPPQNVEAVAPDLGVGATSSRPTWSVADVRAAEATSELPADTAVNARKAIGHGLRRAAVAAQTQFVVNDAAFGSIQVTIADRGATTTVRVHCDNAAVAQLLADSADLLGRQVSDILERDAAVSVSAERSDTGGQSDRHSRGGTNRDPQPTDEADQDSEHQRFSSLFERFAFQEEEIHD